MGWVPPGHISTCGRVHVYFCLLDNTGGLISYWRHIASTAAIVLLVGSLVASLLHAKLQWASSSNTFFT